MELISVHMEGRWTMYTLYWRPCTICALKSDRKSMVLQDLSLDLHTILLEDVIVLSFVYQAYCLEAVVISTQCWDFLVKHFQQNYLTREKKYACQWKTVRKPVTPCFNLTYKIEWEVCSRFHVTIHMGTQTIATIFVHVYVPRDYTYTLYFNNRKTH